MSQLHAGCPAAIGTRLSKEPVGDMNRDGQGSTKYKRPCISENIFLQFLLFKSKTKQSKNFGFPLADCQEDYSARSYGCYVNVPSFQTTLNSQVTTLTTMSVESSALYGRPCQCWETPLLQHLLQQGRRKLSTGRQLCQPLSPASEHSCSIPPEKLPRSNVPTGSGHWM